MRRPSTDPAHEFRSRSCGTRRANHPAIGRAQGANVRCRVLSLALWLSVTCASVGLTEVSSADAERISRAQQQLDAGKPELALGLIKPLVGRSSQSAEAWLIASTAELLLGNTDRGRGQLERALELDPSLRQGWLNRAALDLSQEHHQEALEAFSRAKQLDPSATDNDLNIGAVQLLLGQLDAAQQSFEAYIQGMGASAESFYWVASNYAHNSYAKAAGDHLKQAILRDERIRRRVRTDSNFSTLANQPGFQQLLLVDPYRPPKGAAVSSRTYDRPYQAGQGTFISAMLDVLQFHAIPFEPSVEVTPNWALIWGPVRIKLAQLDAGKGSVTLTAEPGKLTKAQWDDINTKIYAGFAKRVNGLPLIPGVD